MKSDHELECIIDRLGQEQRRLTEIARTGEKAIAELAHFRQSFGVAPEADLVAEFDRRESMARATEQRLVAEIQRKDREIEQLQHEAQHPVSRIVTRDEIQSALAGVTRG